MNKVSQKIQSYNNNTYLSILRYLIDNIKCIEDFLDDIFYKDNLNKIETLVSLYRKIFLKDFLTLHLEFKIKKITTSLYLKSPRNLHRGNSYYHLTLFLKSETITWLDEIYDSKLSKLIRFYKHLFSKIDNFFVNYNKDQLHKYRKVLNDIKEELATFIKYAENREIINNRKRLNDEHLEKIPFKGLFYVTHINNLENILKYGILSHNQAYRKRLVSTNISNDQVNSRRNRIEPVLGENIHNYVPLFLTIKNPTFYYWCKNDNREDLILLKVNPHILLANNVAYTDGNAAVHSTKFYKNLEDFNKLNWKLINSGTWNHYQIEVKKERGRIMSSEVLIYEKVPLYYVTDILVYKEKTLEKLLKLFPNHLGIKVNEKSELFF